MARVTKKQSAVDRTRLTWVLAVLIASMTVGTVVLDLLEPQRALSAEAKYLAATYKSPWATKISETHTPIRNEYWNAIVIHRLGSDRRLACLARERTQPAPPPHFIISTEGEILVITQWAEQKDVQPYPGKIHVGIQLLPGRQDATLEQAQALVSLLRDLQARCRIPAHKVYLHCQLAERACGEDPLDHFKWRTALLP